MKFHHPILLALGLTFASTSYAQKFVLDSSQSFIEVDLQSWVQGEPWGFIDPGSGELEVTGYAWRVESRVMRYALSGSFEWIGTDLVQGPLIGVDLREVNLHAETPKPWQLKLPLALAYMDSTGEISQRQYWAMPCPEGISCYVSMWTWYTPYTTSLSGLRNGDEVRLSGVQNRMTVMYFGTVAGGLEPPVEIPLPDDPTIRYSIVAIAVPEPTQYGLLLASIPLVWLSVRRKRQFR